MSHQWILAAAAVVAFAPPAHPQSTHEDSRLGFRIRAPRDFTKVPLNLDEEWIVARWVSTRAYYQNDPTDGYTWDHKPEMYVIAFEHEKVKEKAEVKTEGTGDKQVKVITIKNPFKDYRDYLRKTYNEGGFYVAEEKREEVEGVPVECLEIKVERMVRGGPRKIVTWIYAGETADVAVQFELVESAWPKL